MKSEEKCFSIGAMNEGDSVVQWGKYSVGTDETKYFPSYKDALEFLREQFDAFVRKESL